MSRSSGSRRRSARLQEFRKARGLVSYNEDQGVLTEKVAALERATMNARMERIAKEALQNQLRSLPAAQIASNPAAVLASPALQEARSRLADLQAEERRLAETLGDRHPDMVRVRAEIRAAEDKLRAEGQGYLRTLQTRSRRPATRRTRSPPASTPRRGRPSSRAPLRSSTRC